MDEYSKLAPKSSKAAAGAREREAKQKARNILELALEEEFRLALLEDFRVDPLHPRFTQMLQLWKARHPHA